MPLLLALFHALGTKPLTVSFFAQLIVLGVALKGKDFVQVRQCVTLLVALGLAITSIALRPPAPVLLAADWLGVIAALLFLVPAVQALLKLRRKSQGKET